jgi:hypothetical protein
MDRPIPFNARVVLPVPMGPTVHWTKADWVRAERLVGSPLRQDLFGYAWLADHVNNAGETVYARGPCLFDAEPPSPDPLTVVHRGETWVALEPRANGQTVYHRAEAHP